MKGKRAPFGGAWTTQKLEVIRKYLSAYTTALKNQPFTTAYIDAFAGTGYRELKDEERNDQLLFPDLAGDDPQRFLEGSAVIALRTKPRFSKYYFVERRLARCAELERLKADFPDLSSDIEVRNEDANEFIRWLGKWDWRSKRAVMFLDPYGMQVDWMSIVAIAATKAIDLWVLFPLGIGVNRLLRRDADIPVAWRRRLESILGTPDWFQAFYERRSTMDILGEVEEEVVKTASTEGIGKYFLHRLRSVFAGVAPNPRVLVNSKNCPLYLLCFAAGNDKGAPLAVKIAKHILEAV